VRAFAINSAGTSYGSTITVETDAPPNQPPTVALNTPNEEVFNTATPTLEFTGTDPEGDDITYQIQISTEAF
jgi:hypothetical protein